MLYTTTGLHGDITVASAIVLAPSNVHVPLPVIAWTHGTTGVAEGCAPSLLSHPFANVPALDAAIGQGWAVVATDYTGLGTAGTGSYLIGSDEAHATLDAVRAAHRLGGLSLSSGTIIWGHSEGGHAALWTGMLAPAYAPDVTLAGVAAMAPASDLPALVTAAQGTIVGKILSAYIVAAYAATYEDIRPNELLRPGAQLLARGMARRCMAGVGALPAVAQAWLAGDSLFRTPPSQGVFGDRLGQNVPAGAIAAPVFIAQGLDDKLVLPRIQQAYVATHCAGQAWRYRTYPGLDHLSLVSPGSPLEHDLIDWSRERFAGKPVQDRCPAERSLANAR